MSESRDTLDYLKDAPIDMKVLGYWDAPDNGSHSKLFQLTWALDGKRKMRVEALSNFGRSSEPSSLRSVAIYVPRWYNIFTKRIPVKLESISAADRSFILSQVVDVARNKRTNGVDFNSIR